MKFAYLIMAHDSLLQLQILLRMLDYSENDIYLHIDKKSNISKEDCVTVVKKARIFFYKSYSVYWADYSQTKCQLFLLREAIKEKHDYYHLLSGHDLPIKTHNEICKFFEMNNGKEFIHFENDEYCDKDNCKYNHYFTSWIKRHPNCFINKYLEKLEKKSLATQKKKGIFNNLYCGANWFSITHKLAVEYCFYHKKILKLVKWTLSSDEYCLQTFYRTLSGGGYSLYAQTLYSNDYRAVVREIDWVRGKPYVWRSSDFDYLMHSDRMFARKFNWNVDREIILKIEKKNGTN